MNSIFETWRKLLSEAKATPGCKLPNRGDIAEGIVAAAIVAKLSAREDGVVGIVTPEDILQQVIRIESMATTVTSVVPDLSGEFEDTISFAISMPKRPFGALMDPGLVHCLVGEYEGAAKYVNSAPMHRFAHRLANNRKSNEIFIKAAGTEDQRGTKVDISIVVDGEKKRNLISLKVKGGDQVAQKTGKGFSVQQAFWEPLGVNIDRLEAPYSELVAEIPEGKPFDSREAITEGGYLVTAGAATSLVYSDAFRQLQSHLDENRLEADFVARLADYIKEGITGPEAEFIELVKIEGGDFKRARFGSQYYKEMEKANLYPVYTESGSYPKIQIIFQDEEGNESVLVQMRSKVERASSQTKAGKRYGVLMRNYLEAGKALYKIAGV